LDVVYFPIVHSWDLTSHILSFRKTITQLFMWMLCPSQSKMTMTTRLTHFLYFMSLIIIYQMLFFQQEQMNRLCV
jgi:hypothetical protein